MFPWFHCSNLPNSRDGSNLKSIKLCDCTKRTGVPRKCVSFLNQKIEGDAEREGYHPAKKSHSGLGSAAGRAKFPRVLWSSWVADSQ